MILSEDFLDPHKIYYAKCFVLHTIKNFDSDHLLAPGEKRH